MRLACDYRPGAAQTGFWGGAKNGLLTSLIYMFNIYGAHSFLKEEEEEEVGV